MQEHDKSGSQPEATIYAIEQKNYDAQLGGGQECALTPLSSNLLTLL